jgi:hypothetical protein
VARFPDDAPVEAEQVGVAGGRQQRARVARLGSREVPLRVVQVGAVVAQQQRVLGVRAQHAAVVLAHPAPAVAASPAARAAGPVPAGAGAVEEAVLALAVGGLEDGRDGGVAEEDGGSREGVEVGPGAAERDGARRGGAGGGEWAAGRGGEPGGAGPRGEGEGARQGATGSGFHGLVGEDRDRGWLAFVPSSARDVVL